LSNTISSFSLTSTFQSKTTCFLQDSDWCLKKVLCKNPHFILIPQENMDHSFFWLAIIQKKKERRVPLVEQELLTRLEHLSSPSFFFFLYNGQSEKRMVHVFLWN
jgi:hypothetical protein